MIGVILAKIDVLFKCNPQPIGQEKGYLNMDSPCFIVYCMVDNLGNLLVIVRPLNFIYDVFYEIFIIHFRI